jgi:hypothetical protein
MDEKMDRSCGEEVVVTQTTSGWVLSKTCKGGVELGTPVTEMLNKICPNCEHAPKIQVVVRLDDGTEREAGVAPLPEVELPSEAQCAALPIADLAHTEPTHEDPKPDLTVTANELAPPPPEPEPEPPPKLPEPTPNPNAIDADALGIGDIVLPGGLTLGMTADPEASVDIDAVIKEKMPELPGGPSSGGLSAHTLGDADCWRKFYYAHIMGLTERQQSKALRFGSLLHYCAAARYLFGAERQFEPCTHVAQAGAAQLAAEVKRLFSASCDKYGVEEWTTWCVRAVEANLTCFLPCPVGKRTKQVPLASRIDLILGLKRQDEPHPAGGAMPGGVYLVDHKTCSAMTRDLLEGYGMDWQFNVQTIVFRLGGYEAVYGPLRGTIVNLFSKGRKTPTPDSFERVRAPLSDKLVDAFMREQIAPVAGEVYRRISDEKMRQDIDAWPPDYRRCSTRWGRCDFFEICEGMAQEILGVAYVTDESMIVHPDKFTKPTAKDAPPAQQVAKKEAKEKAKKADPASDPMTGQWAQMLLGQVDSGDTVYTNLRPDKFLVTGEPKEVVIKDLSGELKLFYEEFASKKVVQEWNGTTWKFLKTGISWTNDTGKGRITWKALATWIAENVWFNLSKATPE